MTEQTKFRAVRGVRDILPPETALWNRVEQTAREVFGAYGFGEIKLPIFEETELFARSVGDETDIVSKEMYSFEDHNQGALVGLRFFIQDKFVDVSDRARCKFWLQYAQEFVDRFQDGLKVADIPQTAVNDRYLKVAQGLISHIARSLDLLEDQVLDQANKQDLELRIHELRSAIGFLELGTVITLRPEATASVVRAYIEHGMQTWPSPVRLYYLGPMFRRDRPQKGRYRQFYQIGAEVLGSNIGDFSIDAEVIVMLMKFFERCGLKEHRLQINSIGCKECRSVYVEKLRDALREVKNQLGADSQRRIETNPLRVLDSKVPAEQPIIETLPRITEHLCEACRTHFEGVKALLQQQDIRYEINERLVRGLDYYVRTTFEITGPGQGSQDAICGGGRYDGLIEQIGGPKFREIKGIGFAIGEDRLIDALVFLGAKVSQTTDIVLVWKDQISKAFAQTVANRLRDSGLSVEVPVKRTSPGDALRIANRLGASAGIVIGPDEAETKKFKIRFLADEDQLPTEGWGLSDRNLGRVLRSRILLERELQQLAILYGMDTKNASVRRLAQSLFEAGALSEDQRTRIGKIMAIINHFMHGEEIENSQVATAVVDTNEIIDELTSGSTKRRFRMG